MPTGGARGGQDNSASRVKAENRREAGRLPSSASASGKENTANTRGESRSLPSSKSSLSCLPLVGAVFKFYLPDCSV